jgi:hypothetical protein
VRLLEGRLGVRSPVDGQQLVTVGLGIVRGKPHNGMLCRAAIERQGEEHACRRVRHPLDAWDEPSTERARAAVNRPVRKDPVSEGPMPGAFVGKSDLPSLGG